MKLRISLLPLALAAIALSLTSCKKKDAPVDGAYGDNVFGEDVAGGYLGSPLPARSDVSFFSDRVQKDLYPPVFFAYDSFEVGGGEEAKVRDVADKMSGQSFDLIIAGFTDDRGTEEYNRGLGEKRAQAVRNALIAQGVSGARIQTVSFGEEMPADPGSDDAAWARNRRAEFGVVPK